MRGRLYDHGLQIHIVRTVGGCQANSSIVCCPMTFAGGGGRGGGRLRYSSWCWKVIVRPAAVPSVIRCLCTQFVLWEGVRPVVLRLRTHNSCCGRTSDQQHYHLLSSVCKHTARVAGEGQAGSSTVCWELSVNTEEERGAPARSVVRRK